MKPSSLFFCSHQSLAAVRTVEDPIDVRPHDLPGTAAVGSSRKTREEELSPKSKAKKERILKLRECGFAVSKERHGLRGVEYYKELRGRCEVEIPLA